MFPSCLKLPSRRIQLARFIQFPFTMKVDNRRTSPHTPYLSSIFTEVRGWGGGGWRRRTGYQDTLNQRQNGIAFRAVLQNLGNCRKLWMRHTSVLKEIGKMMGILLFGNYNVSLWRVGYLSMEELTDVLTLGLTKTGDCRIGTKLRACCLLALPWMIHLALGCIRN